MVKENNPTEANVKGYMLLPCRPDVCQECAVDHPPEYPHNQQSLYYQYKFFSDHGRWPTWTDALAHCPEDIRAIWVDELAKRGICVEPPAEESGESPASEGVSS